MCVEAAYFQVHVFATALEQTNSMETDILRPMVLGTDFDAPQGHVATNATCRHTALWTRIGRANRWGQFDVLQQCRSPVSSAPLLIGLDGRASCRGKVWQYV